jgi:hypothetical protein
MYLLVLTAVIGSATGPALSLAPALPASLLFGVGLDTALVATLLLYNEAATARRELKRSCAGTIERRLK